MSTSPTHVASLAFDTLPFPAVVTGDTLRDSLGVAAPLRAVPYNAGGSPIDGAVIQYIVLDTGVTIDPSGILTAQRRDGLVHLVATAGGLQSATRTLQVTRRPDSVTVTGKLSDTLFYAVPDVPTTNTSPELGIRVITRDTAGGITGSEGWLVSYQAFFQGVPLALSDTTKASLWTEQSRASGIDTAGSGGAASRKLRVRPLGLTTTADSFIVVASVRYRGTAVRGTPVRFVIHIRPKS